MTVEDENAVEYDYSKDCGQCGDRLCSDCGQCHHQECVVGEVVCEVQINSLVGYKVEYRDFEMLAEED